MIVIEQKSLLRAVTAVSVVTKGDSRHLRTVRIVATDDRATLTAVSGSEIGASVTIPAVCVDPLVICVSGIELSKALKTMRGSVVLTKKYGSGDIEIADQGIAPLRIPLSTHFKPVVLHGARLGALATDNLMDALDKVSPYPVAWHNTHGSHSNRTRELWVSVSSSRLAMTATDGYTICRSSCEFLAPLNDDDDDPGQHFTLRGDAIPPILAFIRKVAEKHGIAELRRQHNSFIITGENWGISVPMWSVGFVDIADAYLSIPKDAPAFRTSGAALLKEALSMPEFVTMENVPVWEIGKETITISQSTGKPVIINGAADDRLTKPIKIKNNPGRIKARIKDTDTVYLIFLQPKSGEHTIAIISSGTMWVTIAYAP